MSCFPPRRVPAGVPGCAGQTHGPGREPSQAGSVDQCLPGCPGKDPQPQGVGGGTGPRVPHSTCSHLPCQGGNPPLLPTPSSGSWVRQGAVGHPSVLVQGLGLVVTGTLPVFNLTEDSSDRKVGDCGCHCPGCTGTPGVGLQWGGEGAPTLGAWLRGWGGTGTPGVLPGLHPLPG